VVNVTPRSLYPRERTPAPVEQEAEWATEPVWTFWRQEKSFSLPRFESLVVQPIAKSLYRLRSLKILIFTTLIQ
jgi:hypothetical protein